MNLTLKKDSSNIKEKILSNIRERFRPTYTLGVSASYNRTNYIKNHCSAPVSPRRPNLLVDSILQYGVQKIFAPPFARGG